MTTGKSSSGLGFMNVVPEAANVLLPLTNW